MRAELRTHAEHRSARGSGPSHARQRARLGEPYRADVESRSSLQVVPQESGRGRRRRRERAHRPTGLAAAGHGPPAWGQAHGGHGARRYGPLGLARGRDREDHPELPIALGHARGGPTAAGRSTARGRRHRRRDGVAVRLRYRHGRVRAHRGRHAGAQGAGAAGGPGRRPGRDRVRSRRCARVEPSVPAAGPIAARTHLHREHDACELQA